MPYVDVPAIMQKIASASPTTGRDALRFTVYNAVRSNETRFAVWTEFDLENAIWTIPGERMKARETRSEEHTSELQSLMRISYAVFCLKKKKNKTKNKNKTHINTSKSATKITHTTMRQQHITRK